MKFNLKLHQCCSTDAVSPIMEHIYFKDDKIVATDGQLIMVVSMRDLNIEDFEIELLDGKFIHQKGWQKIWNKEVSITADGLVCRSEYIIVPFSKVEGKFPKWEAIIPQLVESRLGVERIGLNAVYLNRLTGSFPCDTGRKGMFQLHFDEQSKGILVFAADNIYKSYALIMPLMIEQLNPVLNKKTMYFNFQ